MVIGVQGCVKCGLQIVEAKMFCQLLRPYLKGSHIYNQYTVITHAG